MNINKVINLPLILTGNTIKPEIPTPVTAVLGDVEFDESLHLMVGQIAYNVDDDKFYYRNKNIIKELPNNNTKILNFTSDYQSRPTLDLITDEDVPFFDIKLDDISSYLGAILFKNYSTSTSTSYNQSSSSTVTNTNTIINTSYNYLSNMNIYKVDINIVILSRTLSLELYIYPLYDRDSGTNRVNLTFNCWRSSGAIYGDDTVDLSEIIYFDISQTLIFGLGIKYLNGDLSLVGYVKYSGANIYSVDTNVYAQIKNLGLSPNSNGYY